MPTRSRLHRLVHLPTTTSGLQVFSRATPSPSLTLGLTLALTSPTPDCFRLKSLAQRRPQRLSRPRLPLLTCLVVAASSPQVLPRVSPPWGLHHVITPRLTLALTPPTLESYGWKWSKCSPHEALLGHFMLPKDLKHSPFTSSAPSIPFGKPDLTLRTT